jgi:filamentous hemagglutinin family protein
MKNYWFFVKIIAAPCFLAFSSTNSSVNAQIVPDNTLGSEKSRVSPINSQDDRIDGGAIRGSNLFHSFRDFNIAEGHSAYFANPEAIQNIFSRVTGNNASILLGKLGVLGNANLFLINPNGIIFGQNSSLDIRGSFVSSTANSLMFPNGESFSATNPNAPPLLNINTPSISLQFAGLEAKAIINEGNLETGKNFALVGGTVVSTGNLSAPNGEITLSTLDRGSLQLGANGDFLNQDSQLTSQKIEQIKLNEIFLETGDIVILGQKDKVSLQSQKTTLSATNNLKLIDTLIGTTGDLSLLAQNTIFIRDSINNPFLTVAGENLVIEGKEGIDIFALNNPTSELISGKKMILRSKNAVIGDIHFWSGGSLKVEKLDGSLGDLVSPNDPVIRSQGDVFINNYQGASLHILAGGKVEIGTVTITDVDGKGESINPIDTPNLANIILSDGTQLTIDGKTKPTLDIRAGMNTEAIGKPLGTIGGDSGAFFGSFDLPISPPENNPIATSADITIGQISMVPVDGVIFLSNQYKPNLSLSGGDITITGAGHLVMAGIDARGLDRGSDIILDSRRDVNIKADIDARAKEMGGNIKIGAFGDVNITDAVVSVRGKDGGSISIDANNLKIDGEISRLRAGIEEASGTPTSQAGDININVKDTVFVSGGIISNIVDTNAIGNAGDINIQSSSLILAKGAAIDASTLGKGNAGKIEITTSKGIFLEGENSQGLGSAIVSQVRDTAEGNSGGIVINTTSLSLTNGGIINTSIFGKGNAGAIKINASEGISLAGQDTQEFGSGVFSVVQETAEGNSGEILIDTTSLLLKDGAAINASTFGSGNAGAIRITASDGISLVGKNDRGEGGGRIVIGDKFGGEIINKTPSSEDNNSQGLADGLFSQIAPTAEGNTGVISQVASTANGNSGRISIDTTSLSLSNGAAISASTFGQGDAGNIEINASEGISLVGADNQGFVSGIFSQVNSTAKGNSGRIAIDTSSLSLTDGAAISASTFGKGNAGNIEINVSERISLAGESNEGFGSGVFSTVELIAEGNAGSIILNAPQLTLDEGTIITASTDGRGNGGNIIINSPDSVFLNQDSILSVQTSGIGKPGDITISTDTLTIGEDAQLSATATATSTNSEGGGSITLNVNNLNISGKLGIFAETQSIAPAGNLIIQPFYGRGDLAPTLNIEFTDKGFISASTSADGRGGNITISAPQTINIRGEGKIAVETSGQGNAGNINIQSENLTLADGLEISVSTTGKGDAGNINLKANKIDLENSTITASTQGKGKGGSINLTANTSNSIDGSQIRTSTAGSNNAGDINLQIADNLKLTGKNTGIFADTAIDSLGNGGNISIDLSLLQIEDGATVSVNSQGKGIGGNISISSGDLNLNRGTILARSASNQGGNITLKIDNLFTLNNRSQISTTAGTEKAGGDGGNITINANFIVANSLQDSDITANAFTGRGGNINITTQGILGLEVREKLSNLSDITASSTSGLDGTININDPGVDPTTGLENLPQTAIEAEVSQGCQARSAKATIEFYQLGKGGFPASPNDWLTADPFGYEGLIPLETSASSFQKIDRGEFSVIPHGFALSCQK